MARPIVRTPDLTGKDAEKFLAMHGDPVLPATDRKVLEACVEVYRKSKR